MSSATEMVPPIPYNAGTESENASLVLQFLTKSWPKIPDCIATDDEDWEPPAWHAWDEWDQKVNAQEDWTWDNNK